MSIGYTLRSNKATGAVLCIVNLSFPAGRKAPEDHRGAVFQTSMEGCKGAKPTGWTAVTRKKGLSYLQLQEHPWPRAHLLLSDAPLWGENDP